MRNILKSAIAVLCVVCLLVISTPASYAGNTNDNHLLYGRKQLQKDSEINSMTKAYDRIVEGIENREEQIILEDLSLTKDDLNVIVTLYLNDPHPHFWLGNSYSFSVYPNGIIYAFNPRYNELGTVSENEFQKNLDAFNKEVDSIIRKAGIKKGMSQYDIELAIHDVLVKEIDYVSTTNAHNVYGAIVEKEAVCQGYAIAFNYLLRLCGIEAHYVTGYSKGGIHAWSLVSVDGAYYYTDITWDDPLGTPESCTEIFHSYFNLTESALKADHTFKDIPYELPSCNSEGGSYFERNPHKVITSTPDTKAIAALFNRGSASMYIPDGLVDSFKSWFKNNIWEIVALAGYDTTQSLSYIYTNIGNEYHFIINGTLLEKPENSVLLGDVDGDGTVTSLDSNILKRIITGRHTPTEANMAGGDIDGDGVITSLDSNLIKRIIIGIEF